jgi:hypothetical protein
MAKKDNASTRQGERITSESKRAAAGVPSGAESVKKTASPKKTNSGPLATRDTVKRVPESNVRVGKAVAAPSRGERRSLLGSHDTSVAAHVPATGLAKGSRTPQAQHGLSTKGAGVSQQSPSGLRSNPHDVGLRHGSGQNATHMATGTESGARSEQQHKRTEATHGPSSTVTPSVPTPSPISGPKKAAGSGKTTRPSAGKEVIGKRGSGANDKPNVGDVFQSSRGTDTAKY